MPTDPSKPLPCPLCHGPAEEQLIIQYGHDGEERRNVYSCEGKKWDRCPMIYYYENEGIRYLLEDWNSLPRFTAQEVEDKPKWMPIESAPKDGSFIILISQHDGKFGRPYFGNFDHGWLHSDGDPVSPSHFMPLPSPPDAPTGEGVGNEDRR